MPICYRHSYSQLHNASITDLFGLFIILSIAITLASIAIVYIYTFKSLDICMTALNPIVLVLHLCCFPTSYAPDIIMLPLHTCTYF